MGLFDKKSCDICGGKIGMLGNRKLDDGNLCGDCAKKLSPFFSERRKSTVASINDHLAYREENKAAVAAFRATRTIGQGTKVMLDEDNGKFLVTAARRLDEANPDVLGFSQVTGCNIDVNEKSKELMQKGPDGKDMRYTPPRYEYEFEFNCIIHVSHPWFNEIKFKINDRAIKVETIGTRTSSIGGLAVGRRSNDYIEAETLGNEIKSALTQVRKDVRAGVVAAAAPKIAQICPLCGATTMPDASGRCEYCGGAMQG